MITEIGYPSYDGIGHQGYFPDNYHVNLKESADLYQALIESLAGKPWFHGFFPYGIHTENPSEPNNIDYLIYGKPSENVIRTFYGAPTLPAPTPYPEPPADFQKKMVIYDDQMESGWTHAGTTNLVDLSQTQIAKSGSAIKVNIDPFNELTFKHEPYIDFSQYQWLAFDLFVPKQGTHPLVVEVYLRDPNFYSMPFRIVLTYSHYIEGGGIKEGQWQHALIPLSAFGPLFPPVKSIVLSLWYSGPATFYVDNVSLLGN